MVDSGSVESKCRLLLMYSCKNGEGVRDDQAVYYEREEESSVRNRYIMDEVMKRLWKKISLPPCADRCGSKVIGDCPC